LNNWLKIGLPIVMAILLVISAVAITLTVTSGNPSKQVVSASYNPQGSASNTAVATGGTCPNCPVSNDGGTGQPGNGPAVGQGSCCSTGTAGDTGVYIPKSNSRGGCCGGR
jgi:hypothetical protein